MRTVIIIARARCLEVLRPQLAPLLDHYAVLLASVDEPTPQTCSGAVQAGSVTEASLGCTLIQTDAGLRLHPTPGATLDELLQSAGTVLGQRASVAFLDDDLASGSIGAEAVAEAGGLVAAIPTSREHVLSVADHISPREQVVEFLLRRATTPQEASDLDVSTALSLIRHEQLNVDAYKLSMLKRRIARRRNLAGLPDTLSYLNHLAHHPEEQQSLRDDLLVTVTRFFRDPETWQTVLDKVLMPAAHQLNDGEQLRCWVAACATGEEAYTVAILAQEAASTARTRIRIKIFATDADRQALEVASRGWYPSEALDHMSTERRDRWFVPEADGYRVRPFLRECLVFAPHNLTSDAPFNRLSLVTCRNVLMYLRPESQSIVLKRLHFSLRRAGCLVLGSAETPQAIRSGVEPISDKDRIYRKSGFIQLEHSRTVPTTPLPTPPGPETPTRHVEDDRVAYSTDLRRRGATVLFVDEHQMVFRMLGCVERVIQVQEGSLTRDVRTLLPSTLSLPVVAGLHRARTNQEPVRYARLLSSTAVDARPVDMLVRFFPKHANHPAFSTVLVTDALESGSTPGWSPQRPQHMLQLREDLRHTQDSLQVTIQELEVANEHAASTSEELMAANEELQSTNEELHSVNEELHSVNVEHQARLEEMSALRRTLEAVVTSAGVGAVLVDDHYRIKQYTEPFRAILPLTDADLGRSLKDFRHNLVDCDLFELLAHPIVGRDEIVRTRSGLVLHLRIHTLTQPMVSGIVLTIVPSVGPESISTTLLGRWCWEGGPLSIHPTDPILLEAWGVPQANELVARLQDADPGQPLRVELDLADGQTVSLVADPTDTGFEGRVFKVNPQLLQAHKQGIGVVLFDAQGAILRTNDIARAQLGHRRHMVDVAQDWAKLLQRQPLQQGTHRWTPHASDDARGLHLATVRESP